MRGYKTIRCSPAERIQRLVSAVSTFKFTFTFTFALVLGGGIYPVFSAPANAASDELFSASLGNWITDHASTKLTSLLSSHPRFRGERIQVVAMHDGAPALQSDELTQAIRTQLTHRLAQIKGVQIAWGEPPGRCATPKKTPYLLGIEVTREGRNRHLVQVAMVDVEEGIWVNGAHFQWRGQLTDGERRALQARSLDGPSGSIDKPLPASSRIAITERLERQILCSLDGALEGNVHIAAADNLSPMLADLAAMLTKRMLRNAWLSVAQNADSADWHLTLVAMNDVSDSVVATLTANRNGEPDRSSLQRLAAVYVRTTGPSVREGRLLGALTPFKPSSEEPCFNAGVSCSEVGFELHAPAHVWVLRNADGEMHLGQCSLPRKTSGAKRYRFAAQTNKGAGHGAPGGVGGVSLYAIATVDGVLARKLHAQLAGAAVNCRGRNDAPRGDWLAQLEALIQPVRSQIHWRVLHSAGDSANADAVGPDLSQAIARLP